MLTLLSVRIAGFFVFYLFTFLPFYLYFVPICPYIPITFAVRNIERSSFAK
nr:MAG TPA: hypothetical protein [Caudoviricetes sp.]